MKVEMFCGHMGKRNRQTVEYSNYSTEFIGTWRTQWVWLSHALSTLLYITIRKKTPSFINSLLPASFLPPLPANWCESMCVCVDAFPGETTRAWQSENKQSADVCVGIVWEIMLTRRHFSLIQIRYFLIKYAEEKKTGLQEIVRTIKITAWTIFHYLKDRKYHILKTSTRDQALPPFWLAVLLREGHFFCGCVCRILWCLPPRRPLKIKIQINWINLPRSHWYPVSSNKVEHNTRGRPFRFVRHFEEHIKSKCKGAKI